MTKAIAYSLKALVLSVIIALPASAEEFDWSPFQAILDKYLSEGEYQGVQAALVDYKPLTKDRAFDQIGKELAKYNPNNLNREEKLVFYINAYNYFAMKVIVDNYPIESIRDVGNIFRPVWKRDVGKINREEVTLHQIEHEILREMDEPRIHFAIVCSSMSCPDIRNEVYSVAKLNEQLDEQVRAFLDNSTKGAIIKQGELHVSQIFDWFEEDFESYGGVTPFLAKYDAKYAEYDDLEWLKYNWTLNSASPR